MPRTPADVELACPADGAKLSRASASITCEDGCRWEVVNSIPRFVAGRHYSEPFGLQWRTFPKVQLDSHTGLSISLDRAKFCLGGFLHRLADPSDALNVLEAGCGAGRFTEILLSFPSVRVHSIDSSTAVEANSVNCPQDERHRIHQADILRLPFAPRQFDLVFCLGVVQHTESPEETIGKLYEQVRPGGTLLFDHYVSRVRGLTNPVRVLCRFLIKRMTPERGLRATTRLVDLFLPFYRAARNSPFLLFLLSKILPLHTGYHHPQLNDRQQYEYALLNTHDGLTDWYNRSRTERQIERILTDLGAEQIEVFRGSNGVVGRCRRPVQALPAHD